MARNFRASYLTVMPFFVSYSVLRCRSIVKRSAIGSTLLVLHRTITREARALITDHLPANCDLHSLITRHS